MSAAVNLAHQQVILARIIEFCTYSEPKSIDDLWVYLRGKIDEALEHLGQLKQQQLLWHRGRFVKAMKEGALGERDIAEFKAVLDSYLSPGDYADIAIHLSPEDLANPERRAWLLQVLQSLKPHSLAEEELKPEAELSSRSRKLLDEIYHRLKFDFCEQVLARKTRTPRRKRMVLRRIRHIVSEYCSVLHFPTSPDDTLSPFLLPRVEAMLVACRRLLRRYR